MCLIPVTLGDAVEVRNVLSQITRVLQLFAQEISESFRADTVLQVLSDQAPPVAKGVELLVTEPFQLDQILDRVQNSMRLFVLKELADHKHDLPSFEHGSLQRCRMLFCGQVMIEHLR